MFYLAVTTNSSSQIERASNCMNITNYTSVGACDVTLSTSLRTTTPPPMQPTTLISLEPPLSLPVIVGAATGIFLIITSTIFIVIVCLCARRRTCVFTTPLKHRASFHDNPTYTSPGTTCHLHILLQCNYTNTEYMHIYVKYVVVHSSAQIFLVRNTSKI